MRKSTIYVVSSSYEYELVPIRPSVPYLAYFSNLTLVVNSIESNLGIKGWPTEKINYTAIYRAMKAKNRATITLRVKGSAILTIRISKVEMNVPLETLGIDEYPHS